MLTTESAPVLLQDISEEEQERILRRFAHWILQRHLDAPAIVFLEMCKPLNFVGSQLLLALDPLIRGIFTGTDYRKFALIIEKDQNLERLIQLIERGVREEDKEER